MAATIAEIKQDKPEEILEENDVETDPNDGSETEDPKTPNPNDQETDPHDGSGNPTPPKAPDPAPVPGDTPKTPDHNIKEEGTPPATPTDETEDF
ncbi:MAG: hypothetical protein Q4B28_03005 [bacterium]|nr:hypothetical protein [bacterium]